MMPLFLFHSYIKININIVTVSISKEWPKIQVLMGKTGKESLMRKISKFDAQACLLKQAQIAKKTIAPFNKDQIRDTSAGVATFYIWVSEYHK